ncbi:hypothetical protein Tco_0498388, partial [Tanacetum coccineum]
HPLSADTECIENLECATEDPDEDLSAVSSAFTSPEGGIKEWIGYGERSATLHM